MTAKTVDVSYDYKDVDMSEYSEEELLALGFNQEQLDEFNADKEAEEKEEDESEEDEEDEEEEDTEEEDGKEEEPEEEEEEEKKDYRIPKARFDEAVQKEREKAIRAEERAKYLEERIELLLQQQQQVSTKESQAEPDFDFDEAESNYAELLISGEIENAAKLRRQIENKRNEWVENLVKEVKSSITEEATRTTKKLSEDEKKDVVVQKALAEYPSLDINSSDYDEDAVDSINFLASGYINNKNMSADKAFDLAIKRVMGTPAKPKTTKKVATKKASAAGQPPKVSSSKSVKDKSPEDINWEDISNKEFERLYKDPKTKHLVLEAMGVKR